MKSIFVVLVSTSNRVNICFRPLQEEEERMEAERAEQERKQREEVRTQTKQNKTNKQKR